MPNGIGNRRQVGNRCENEKKGSRVGEGCLGRKLAVRSPLNLALGCYSATRRAGELPSQCSPFLLSFLLYLLDIFSVLTSHPLVVRFLPIHSVSFVEKSKDRAADDVMNG